MHRIFSLTRISNTSGNKSWEKFTTYSELSAIFAKVYYM